MQKRTHTILSLLVILCTAILVGTSTTMYAAKKVKTYKASKVTAKQIVTELKKTCPVGKAYKHKKGSTTEGQINSYKTKASFYDKKYKKVYCSVEVFEDSYDAVYRKAYLDSLAVWYATWEWDEDIPLLSFRYKNVLFRYPTQMPYKYASKYYYAIKKIVK